MNKRLRISQKLLSSPLFCTFFNSLSQLFLFEYQQVLINWYQSTRSWLKDIQETEDKVNNLAQQLARLPAMLDLICRHLDQSEPASLGQLPAKQIQYQADFVGRVQVQGRTIRIDFPLFTGEDPSGWVFGRSSTYDSTSYGHY